MSVTMTRDQIKAMIAEVVQDKFGMSPENLREMQAEMGRIKAAQDEVRREHVGELARDKAPKKYLDKAAHIIKADKFGGAGLRPARAIRAVLAAKMQGETPENIAKAWDDKELADDLAIMREQTQKALTQGTLSSGGVLVPEQFSNELIELLRSKSIMRQAGVMSIPMPGGTLTMPRQSSAGTAAYVGENSNITASTQALEQIQLTGKKLAALTAISNDLVRSASPQVDLLVRNDLAKVMGLKEDLSFIRGDGTSGAPRGVRYRTASANVFARTQASGTGSTYAEVTLDMMKAMRLVEANNVQRVSPFWMMTSVTKYALSGYRDGNGNLIWAGELLAPAPRWGGVPVYISNQIPTTLGGGDETEVYFCEGSEMMIGDEVDLMIEVFPNATYYDGSNTVSGVSQDTSVVRAISKHDFAMRHPVSCSIISTVDWPA